MNIHADLHDVLREWVNDGGTYEERDRRQAIATPVEALPDLLTALHNTVNAIALALSNEAWGEESSDNADSREEIESVLDSARAAIAKAEGVKP